MATPDIHGFEAEIKLPQTPVSLPKQAQWKGRSVEQMEHMLGEVEKMLHYDIPAQQQLIESLKKTVSILQSRDTPLETKIGILIDAKLREQIQTLKSLLSKSEEIAELSAITSALDSAVFQFARLQSCPNREKISEVVLQVSVLQQYADGTGASGFENCGYHALKNALLSLSPAEDASKMEKLFLDKQLFQEFYTTYCKGVIDSFARTGKRDASLPMLHQILQNMREDRHPPANLAIFQQAISGQNLGIYNVGALDDRLQFGFFDEQGLKEAHKLYHFATQPGPQMLALVVGDESMGHWYAMTAYKDRDGILSFVGCDSMDNHHSDLRGNSSLYKMAALIEDSVHDPQSLMKQAYTTLGDEMERMAGRVSDNGNIAAEYHSNFFDVTPNPLLANPAAPNGSPKELMIAKCLAALDFMIQAGWMESHDYESQLHLSNLEAILKGYKKNLLADDPIFSRVQEALKIIRKRRLPHAADIIFGEALKDFEKLKSQVPHSAYQNSFNTFSWMRKVQAQKHEIAQEKNDNARNDKINRMTGGGAEPGFSSGKTASEAERTLTGRINLLLLTYQKAKSQNMLKEFMIKMGEGDPCLTGRMAAVEQFAEGLAGFGQLEDAHTVKITEFAGQVIAEVLEDLVGESQPVDYLKAFQIEELAKKQKMLLPIFKKYENTPNATIFLQYLSKQGIGLKNPIDWETLIPKLLELPECKNWLAKAKTLVYI